MDEKKRKLSEEELVKDNKALRREVARLKRLVEQLKKGALWTGRGLPWRR